MLVLTRKIEQKVYLQIEGREDDIVITITDFSLVRGVPQVKIGFDAPRDVRIIRDDIGDRYPKTRKQG